MRRSLTVKWIFTLLFTSLVGVVLIGLVVNVATTDALARLHLEQGQAAFEAVIATYYREHGTLDGVDAWYREQNPPPDRRPNAQQPGNAPPQPAASTTLRPDFIVANLDGILAKGARGYPPGSTPSDDLLASGTPLVIDGETVGTVIYIGGIPELDAGELRYLQRTNTALLIGAIGAIAAAFVVGTLLSRLFLRPLRQLTTAIHAMEDGDLAQQVHVNSGDELGELAQAFNRMSTALADAHQLRRQLTADIAHELRTPLTVVSGYLEALHDGTLSPSSERFATMHREMTRLNRLVEDLRTLSLADANELNLAREPIAPETLLSQVISSFKPVAEAQQVTLEMRADASLPTVELDHERMTQVFSNLISNALRYARSRIVLIGRHEKDSLYFAVQDDGTGIAPDALPHIFERFYYVDNGRRGESDSSGLGLAIVRSIVEAHGGSISAESEPERGTTFHIRLAMSPVKA